MSKLAVVSFGMSDMIIPQMKHFAVNQPDVEVTLILIYAQNKKKEGIVNFSALEVSNGWVPSDQLSAVLGDTILEYIDGHFNIEVFIYQDQKFKNLKNLALSGKLIARLKSFNLIHINGIGGTLPQLFPFLALKKWLLTVHDFKPHSGEAIKAGTRVLNMALKRAQRVIIQNQPDFREIQQNYPELAKKTSFVPFGYLDVYPAFLPESLEDTPESELMFFGRISKYKGLEYLLDAIEILRAKGIQPRVVLAGGGNYDFGIDRLKGLGEITFLNRYVDNDELAALISRTGMVVCPYTDATQSGVLMTAFAFHKPVIATAVGGFRDAVVEGVNGYLVPPGEAEPLADAIEKLLGAEGKRDELQENIGSYQGLAQFEWGSIARTLREVYQILVKKPAIPTGK